MVSRCIPHGLHVDSMWFPCGQHVVSMWTPCGFQVDTTSFPDHFSCLIKSKTYQSLKAHNFLNNGLIFNPQKVLESSWSPLSIGTVFMSFPHQWKQPRHFPLGQISLQSHVTTLNQPIRSLNSLKSPSSRRHFCDFVRFHPKFHPHLKSKAVRTALLKRNNLARQLYCELEEIAEQEAPSTYTPRPPIESAPRDESYVI